MKLKKFEERKDGPAVELLNRLFPLVFKLEKEAFFLPDFSSADDFPLVLGRGVSIKPNKNEHKLWY